MIVRHMENRKRAEGVPYQAQCLEYGIAWPSFKRWRHRIEHDRPIVVRPGPKKVEPLNLDALREDIRLMKHGRKRSAGTGDLYRKHQARISRRDLQLIVNQERAEQNAERNRIIRQVNWKVPRLIWSMDDTEYKPFKEYPKSYLHNVHDMGSRYKFDPLVGTSLVHGDQIAENLKSLFERHGPPLFLKRDNGGNLNHEAVDALLEAFLVIPLNSPVAYPRYNGGMEKAQREVKETVASHNPSPSLLGIQAQLDVQKINHQCRPVLGNRTSCEVFASGLQHARKYTKRKRKEVYETIREMTLEIIEGGCCKEDTAWRHAAEIWLLDNGFITVSNNNEVLPHYQ